MIGGPKINFVPVEIFLRQIGEDKKASAASGPEPGMATDEELVLIEWQEVQT